MESASRRYERTPFGACPICGSADEEVQFVADASKHALWRPCFSREMTWLECLECGHSHTSGYYAGAALDELLDKVQPGQTPGANIERDRILAAPVVERVLSKLGDLPLTWFDVGPGNGALMATAQEFGFAARGVEARPYVADGLRRLGLSVVSGELSDGPQEYSVVSMADVLEHLPSPTSALLSARSKLLPGGILFVSCPAYNSPAWRMLGNENPYWWEIEHFQNFSRANLENLLRDHGFAPIHYDVSRRYRVGMEILAKKIEQ